MLEGTKDHNREFDIYLKTSIEKLLPQRVQSVTSRNCALTQLVVRRRLSFKMNLAKILAEHELKYLEKQTRCFSLLLHGGPVI